ncbi:hypothetical protein DSECCO2_486400 [anaerobic digester metagenome]
MKKCFLLLFLFPALVYGSDGDTLRRPLTLSLFTNATKIPGSGFAGVLNTPLHPGFTFGTEFSYKQTETNKLFQTAKFGYFYHRLAQHALMLYTEGAYRHTFACGFSMQALLGAGYLHSIPALEKFEQNNDGEYVRVGRFGRPQGMAGITLGLGYNICKKNPLRIGLDYQVWFQFPFVAEYVPVLPNTALHLTLSYSIPK